MLFYSGAKLTEMYEALSLHNCSAKLAFRDLSDMRNCCTREKTVVVITLLAGPSQHMSPIFSERAAFLTEKRPLVKTVQPIMYEMNGNFCNRKSQKLSEKVTRRSDHPITEGATWRMRDIFHGFKVQKHFPEEGETIKSAEGMGEFRLKLKNGNFYYINTALEKHGGAAMRERS